MAVCWKCRGRGGFQGPFGWQRCECQTPTKGQREALRRLQSTGAPHRQMTIDEMIQQSEEARRGDR